MGVTQFFDGFDVLGHAFAHVQVETLVAFDAPGDFLGRKIEEDCILLDFEPIHF